MVKFWDTLSQANNLLREIQANTVKPDTLTVTSVSPAVTADTTKTSQSLEDLIGKDTSQVAASTREEFNLQNPLFGLLNPRVDEQGQPLPSSMIGLAAGIDTAQVNDYLSMNQIKSLFPRDMIFRWSQNPYKYDPTKSLYELHAIKITTRDGRAPASG